MKQVLIVAIFLFALFSCDKNHIEYTNDFERSFKTFQQFKANTNNSYRYTTNNTSMIGMNTENTITVEKGQIIEHNFKYTWIGKTQIPSTGWTKEIATQALLNNGYLADEIPRIFGKDVVSKLQWTKNKADIDLKSADNYLMTLDQIYEKAKNKWLKKRPNAKIYFETKNNGLISHCGYVEKNCYDECFVGLNITKIEKLAD